MGLEILGGGPEEWAARAHGLATHTAEMARRSAAAERVQLYRDDYAAIVARTLATIFNEPAVVRRVTQLTGLIGGTSFIKRVADELGRPIYARAPTRRVVTAAGEEDRAAQMAFNALAVEMRLTERMDTVARLLTACNDVHVFVRHVGGLGMQLDVMTPDCLSVIPHPEAPTVPLAVVYEKSYHGDRPNERLLWDDRRYIVIDRQGKPQSVVDHELGRLPVIGIHQPGRTSEYWQPTRGQDLVSQTKQSMFLDCILVRKVKSQSHIQLTYVGDSAGFVKDQVADEDSVISADGGVITSLNLESDPRRYVETKLAAEAAVGANHGINRERLNQQTRAGGADEGLHERIAELAGVLADGEVRLFEVIKAVARQHAQLGYVIPMDARLLVDLGTIHHRVDRTTQLAIRQTERSMGLRSGVDDVLEDNPELGGDRAMALRFIDEKMAEEAVIIERRRALNMPADASSDEPGQAAVDNGAMGPAVRDGSMTRDEAASRARTGRPPD